MAAWRVSCDLCGNCDRVLSPVLPSIFRSVQ